MEIIFSLQNTKELDGWGWYLTGGIIYLLFGILLISNPALSVSTLSFVVGFFVMFRAMQQMSFAFEMKNYGLKNWGWTMVWAVLGLIFSFILIWNPLFAGLSLVIWTGLAIIMVGISACFLAFQLKGLKKLHKNIPEEWKERFQKLKEEYHQRNSG